MVSLKGTLLNVINMSNNQKGYKTYNYLDQYRDVSFSNRIESSDAYLNAAKELREKIRREREI